MALRADATLEAFINKIISNEKLAELLNIPQILDTDSKEIKNKKRKLIIDKVISKSSQVPYELGKEFPEITIAGKKYKNYMDTRITVSFAQSIAMHDDVFGNPQVDICIYYDNTNIGNTFKILDLLSDEFSGKDLKIDSEDDKSFLRNIRNEGITSQTAIINNYERVGIRFSFFVAVYKNY